MTKVLELNDINFDNEVKRSTLPVLVDFYATWCGPCKKQIPVMDEVAQQFSGKALVAKMNIDEGQAKSTQYGISSIPALLIFKNGEVVERMIGLHSKEQLASILNKYQ